MRFVRTARYRKDLRRIGASEADAAAIEAEIATHPLAGDLIPGLEGLRKLRFRLGNKGKRGGGRALYFLMVNDNTAVLLLAYTKSEQEDMSARQKRDVLDIVRELKRDR